MGRWGNEKQSSACSLRETTTRINSCLRPGLENKLCLMVSCREPISWRSEEPKQEVLLGASLDERELSVYRVVSLTRKSGFFGDVHGSKTSATVAPPLDFFLF